MEELTEYRKKLLERLGTTMKEFKTACLAVKNPYEAVEAGGWNVHRLAAHTRDVDKMVYGMRIRRTLEEDNPAFPNFDGDAYMAEHYDAKESLKEILEGLTKSIQALVELLNKMPAEGWSRLSSHATQGSGLTLQVWVERALGHLEEHLATVKKAGG